MFVFHVDDIIVLWYYQAINKEKGEKMNPLIPMLALTGNPTNRQIHEMLAAYKAVGIDSVMVYPRSGLGVPYMSDAWRSLCTVLLDQLAALGMHMWLYDEFNWPSGSCNNTVIQEHPSFAARRFVWKNGAVQVETVKPGSAERVMEPFDNDMLNPDAVQCFIRLTHEKYAAWFGNYFGNTILGMFTDEPSFIYTANGENMFPYYDGVEEEYAAACGRDLRADIAAFLCGKSTAQFPGVFRKLVGRRFRTVYINRVAAWCRAHQLVLTGHTLEDESPLHATRVTGDWFAFMENVDQPGVDEIPTRFGTNDDILFSMVENLRLNGKKNAMAELFALGPCSMSFARRRQMLWYAAVYGVNHFFIAISHFDATGNVRKPDFFDNFNLHCPDFDGVRILAKEAKAAAAVAEKKITYQVGVRLPYTAYLAALGKRREDLVERQLKLLVEALLRAQIGWRILREDEACDAPYIFSVQEDGFTEEKTGKHYTVAADALKHIQAPLFVTDVNGKKLSTLCVKTFTDGSTVVIDRENRAAGRRQCILHNGNRTIPFVLESYGVQVFDKQTVIRPAMPRTPLEIVSVLPQSDNLYRLMLLQKRSATVQLTAPLTVKVHACLYPAPAETVTLDGKRLFFPDACHELTGCFSHLYRTATITLSVGKHTFETTAADYPYLPALLLSGDFAYNGDILSPRDENSRYFFGKTAVTVRVPENIGAIEMEDCGLFVTAAVNEKVVDSCAFAPYRFKLPPETETVTLTFHSTLAPLFGDMAHYLETGEFSPAWTFVPASSPETLNLKALHIGGVPG